MDGEPRAFFCGDTILGICGYVYFDFFFSFGHTWWTSIKVKSDYTLGSNFFR